MGLFDFLKKNKDVEEVIEAVEEKAEAVEEKADGTFKCCYCR